MTSYRGSRTLTVRGESERQREVSKGGSVPAIVCDMLGMFVQRYLGTVTGRFRLMNRCRK